ncbi:hypothetical protein PPERSA_01941 [Pseudocohnilembus persalinus]|uniref:MORN motif n=1 Tax=Pseudocohnilembus persalinus TaxID=266149 RepID=A0A0V0R3M6_PSEPJ|nr:hypothetical protein PPERSA_01941 [Pseudocohnilembus persalinus]|eukprot:KRX09054.1 hypothetical protein PPERSA_01941 [Pseudocohnilembus persalinus]
MVNEKQKLEALKIWLDIGEKEFELNINTDLISENVNLLNNFLENYIYQKDVPNNQTKQQIQINYQFQQQQVQQKQLQIYCFQPEKITQEFLDNFDFQNAFIDQEKELKNGIMKKYTSINDIYIGEIIGINIYQGKGVLYKSNNLIYFGEFQNSKMQGQGTAIGLYGDRYFGHFQNDFKNGIGEQLYSNGSIYHGNWLNNKKEGFGYYFVSNQNITIIGNFQNNILICVNSIQKGNQTHQFLVV